jgi:hypothetical protein
MSGDIKNIIDQRPIKATIQGAIIGGGSGGGGGGGGATLVTGGTNITATYLTSDTVEVATVNNPTFTGVNFNTTTPITISSAGQLAWNDVDGTVDIGLKNNIKLKTGQQLYFYGKAQGTIAKRDVVQFVGFEGDHILIKKAVGAEIEAFPEGLLGVAKQSFTNGQFGYVTWFGEVDGVSTTGWAVGDILYFDNVTGGLTNVAPLAPNRRIVIAAVEKLATGMAQNGVLLVRPTFGLKLKELDDVNGTALTTTGQIPSYNASTGYFDFTENINNKQNTLVSGTNIKTIEGQSLLGSGNIDITKSDVGLGNVDNTSDLNKPISTATQTALDGKVDKVVGKGLSTEDYTTAEKNKLAGISGTNTGDQNLFSTIAVAGQSNVVADSTSDTLTLVAGSNITLTTNATNDEITIASTGGGGGGSSSWGSITGTLSNQTDLQTALNGKEPTITAGTTGEYYRGDKTFQTLNKAAVGLGNVDNTSDLNKPISTATQTALDGKVDKNLAITGATKTKITYDAKGLVTAGADAGISDISGLQTALDGKTDKLVVANRQTASYTLVLTDADKLVEMNVATANNLTIPLNSSVAFPTGTQILLAQYGAGQTTVVATSGVTIRSSGGKLKLSGQYSGATLIKIDTNEWYLFGDITS